MRTLVLGGARSGKSALGEDLVADDDEPVVYVATGRRDPSDDDWSERIARHRRRRPAHWTTIEAATADEVVDVLRTARTIGSVLVDDLGTWLTGALDDARAWDRPRGTVSTVVDSLVDAVARSERRVVLVSPEVGLGVIPSTRAGRLFRDEIGALNARLAAVCDDAYLVVAGLATTLKSPEGSR